jgi:C4-dicarboxylate-specific signal transduction histidine kinase
MFSRDRANAYLELNEAILLSLDAGRRIRESNARGARLLGTDWLDLFVGEPERERAHLMLESAYVIGNSREREFDARINGETRRISWRCVARRNCDGSLDGWLCSGTDVTDRVRQHEGALLAHEQLTRVARMATMGEMATGVAHELNQPLTAITTYARACEHFVNMPQPDLAELREAVREIGEEGRRAARIVAGLRQLVRGDDHVAHVPTDINALIEQLRVLLNADARVHDTRLSLTLSPHLPRVNANPVQLQQLVLNLARNAFEALDEMPTGNRELDLATLSNEGDVEIRISDNGPGVSSEIAGRLFDTFATTKKFGTGLGLAISRTIVRAHGGTIEPHAVLPHGASFHVRLPASETVGT